MAIYSSYVLDGVLTMHANTIKIQLNRAYHVSEFCARLRTMLDYGKVNAIRAEGHLGLDPTKFVIFTFLVGSRLKGEMAVTDACNHILDTCTQLENDIANAVVQKHLLDIIGD